MKPDSVKRGRDSLEAKRREIVDELILAKADKQGRKVISKRLTLRQIDAQLEKLQSEEAFIVVLDHAVIRYLERVEGMDIESLREKIIATEREKILTLGQGNFPTQTEEGKPFMLKVRNNTVITVQT